MTDKKDNKPPTETEARSVATVFMWLGYLGILYMAMDKLGTWSALIAFVVMIPLIIAMGMMWGAFKPGTNATQELSAEDVEKRKRERIDSVLRDLSDDDLLRIRERLVSGTINDEMLYEQMVGDDGELMYKG